MVFFLKGERRLRNDQLKEERNQLYICGFSENFANLLNE